MPLRILLENHREMIFFCETQFLFIFGARECAHVRFDVKSEFVNRSGVGFHFKSLSLDET